VFVNHKIKWLTEFAATYINQLGKKRLLPLSFLPGWKIPKDK